MSFHHYRLADEHEHVRQAVRELAEKVIAPHAAEVHNARFPKDAHDALVQAGFHATHIPEEYEGVGADSIATCIVIEELARVSASSALIPAANKLGSMPVILSGSEELKRQVLPPVARGEAMFSYALSEREAGACAAAMRTRAVRDGDHWVLNGAKYWITNAGVSTYYTVMAKTDPSAGAQGISAFVVHRDDPGLSVGDARERRLGVTPPPTCEIYLEDCTIPADRIVGEPGTGFSTAVLTQDHTRLTIGAQALGISQGALDTSKAYVRQREQFGQPVGDAEGVQSKLADMAVNIEAARQMIYVAAASAGDGEPHLNSLSAAAAECFASDVAMQVTAEAVQLFGAAAEQPVPR